MFLVSILLAGHIKICYYCICLCVYFCPSGWQSRWFVLDGGVLSYYLSAEDVRLGCRGSVRMASCSLRGEVCGQLFHTYIHHCVTVSITELTINRMLAFEQSYR